MPPILSPNRQWSKFLRPLLWWLLLVLALFGIREHEIWLAKTKIQFSVTMNGHSVDFDAVAKLDGQPITSGMNISLGSHMLSISHPKADPFGTNFFVWYGGQNVGEIKLKRSQGSLMVQANPAASTVMITGPEFSRRLYDTASTNLMVPTDSYTIEAKYPHWSQSKNVTVMSEVPASCLFSPQFGALRVSCNHEGATFDLHFANGQSVDSGRLPATVASLPPGSYEVMVSYHQRQLQKTILVTVGLTNDVRLEFALGAARLETVPAGADVRGADGSNWGRTPLDVADIAPGAAQFNLSLRGYEPVAVTMDIITDQTNTCRTNLVSLQYLSAIRDARQHLAAGNYDAVVQATGEALSAKPEDAAALALRTTANENLNAARKRADVERQQAEAARQSLERLKRPRLVFASLCGKNPDAALFEEYELKTRKPAKEVEAAIVKSLQISPGAFQISADDSPQPETYAVTAHQTFSLGILGGTERVCLLVVGQTKNDETQVLFKVLEYQIKHTIESNNLLNFQDNRQMIPMHPSRMQMTEIQQSQVQNGVRTVMDRVQRAIGDVL